ncbi:nicotinamide riboside kinase 1 isoform X3 [Podarcis raffonei]|uniref:nicotinamide riboside kinase 1 isoform X3 n=1 Tax=Podarcis raffonei TaxID=65483 RepID=UPI002329626B|nr:nicotinamide riboside kinase 1 isoform X3 [Podarcis raffonei]
MGCERTVEMLVIGLGGITNGGKTTLAKRLKKQLPNCTILSQDDYFKPESEVAVDDQGFLQYDVLDALHMEKMVADIRSWMTNLQDSALTRPLHDNQKGVKDTHVLIVEGFLLYNYKPLSDIWNKKYFITIPYEECKKRRRSATWCMHFSPCEIKPSNCYLYHLKKFDLCVFLAIRKPLVLVW